MCQMCEGWSLEEVRQDLSERIDRFGWALQGVTGPRPWVYTIGLTERFGHPELIMAGVDISCASFALNVLGAGIGDGETFTPGLEGVDVDDVPLDFGQVHPVHVASGLVAMWEDHYTHLPGAPPPLEVVQVIPQPSRGQPLLDRPHTNLHLVRAA
jgi:hypothetical protein